jgi:hypothetical protein
VRGSKGAALTSRDSEKLRRRRKNRGTEGQLEEEERLKGAKDLIAKYRNFKGLKVKLNFPLLQGSNGEMTKMKMCNFSSSTTLL